MGCPRILPRGSDRSWTRAFYYGINRVFRRIWWQERIDVKLEKAVVDVLLYGHAYLTIGDSWTAI
jgi:hypothetical protein